MVNVSVPAAAAGDDSVNAQCSVCAHTFKSVQECLKHELLDHTMKKTSLKTADSRVKATSKFLSSKDKQEERQKVHIALEKSQKGQELLTVFKLLSMDTESLGLIFTRIQTCLEKELMPLGPVKIFPFGSIASGLALRDSDIDIFLDASHIPAIDFGHSSKHRQKMPNDYTNTKQSSHQRGAFNRIHAVLQRSPLFVDVFPIRAARVPIIKCKHRDTGFSIDINISCPSSMANTQFICELIQSDRRIHELMVFLKLWAKNMQIIGRSNMTSYCLITMIIFYLQQPYKSSDSVDINNPNPKILKSIRELQTQCIPRMVQGINYAFDLHTRDNKPCVPKGLSSFDLIKGFFQFYKDYNFEENLISPFYGTTIDRKNFTGEQFKEYSRQLVTITHYYEGSPAEPIQLDRCMCVQDSFGLNHNVARTMLPPNKKYLVMCVECAATMCENVNNSSKCEILEKLLYESFSKSPPSGESNDIALLLRQLNSTSHHVTNNTKIEKKPCHTIAPTKSDLNCIVSYDPSMTDSESILRFWCQHYISAIQNIMSDFYHMDMQAKSHTPLKQQRLDNQDLSQSWQITASVDLWSKRFFQKSTQQTFWEYQMAQTERLDSLRRQDAKFAVQFNATLNVDIASDYSSISIYISLPDGSPITALNKKDPIRKFSNILNNTLQNYSLKDALLEDKSAAKPKT